MDYAINHLDEHLTSYPLDFLPHEIVVDTIALHNKNRAHHKDASSVILNNSPVYLDSASRG